MAMIWLVSFFQELEVNHTSFETLPVFFGNLQTFSKNTACYGSLVIILVAFVDYFKFEYVDKVRDNEEKLQLAPEKKPLTTVSIQ